MLPMAGKKTSAAAPPEGEPQSKQQRTSHKAENKLWLIEHKAKNPALGYPELCAAYKNKFNRSINKSQVCKWLKKASDLKALPKKAAKGICRLKAPPHQELEDIVVKYYRQVRFANCRSNCSRNYQSVVCPVCDSVHQPVAM